MSRESSIDRIAERDPEAAAFWLLRTGYGTDHHSDFIAPLPILEAMVKVMATHPDFDWMGVHNEEEAYFVLSAELGDWRAEPSLLAGQTAGPSDPPQTTEPSK